MIRRYSWDSDSPILECAIFILTMFSLRQYHFDYSIERHNPIVRIIARDGACVGVAVRVGADGSNALLVHAYAGIIYFAVSIMNSLYNILVG